MEESIKFYEYVILNELYFFSSVANFYVKIIVILYFFHILICVIFIFIPNLIYHMEH
jgi:hypothetical protein